MKADFNIKQPKYKVNDIHVHLGPSRGMFQNLTVSGLKKYQKKFSIENVGIIPLEMYTDRDNKKIINLSKKDSSVHGLYWIQKRRIKQDVKVLQEELGKGLFGVKFHGTFENLPISSKHYKPILEELNEQKSTILIHCGRYKDGSLKSNTSYLHGLHVAKKYLDLKIILAHMGGNDTSIVKKAVDDAKDMQNVYFDTSGISTPYRVEYAIKVIGSKRIVFGSDYPWCSFRGNFYNIEDSLLSKTDKNRILYKNFFTFT